MSPRYITFVAFYKTLLRLRVLCAWTRRRRRRRRTQDGLLGATEPSQEQGADGAPGKVEREEGKKGSQAAARRPFPVPPPPTLGPSVRVWLLCFSLGHRTLLQTLGKRDRVPGGEVPPPPQRPLGRRPACLVSWSRAAQHRQRGLEGGTENRTEDAHITQHSTSEPGLDRCRVRRRCGS